MNRSAVAVGAFVLVAAVLWAVVIFGGDSSPKPEAANPQAPPAPPAAPSAPAPSIPEPAAAPTPAATPQPSAPSAMKAPAAVAAEPTRTEDPPSENRVPAPENVGNLELLKGRFEQEPRDSAAADDEAKIQAAFRASNMPPGLLASALCRQTVCKTVFNWTEGRAEGYMGGLMQLSDQFEMARMAIDEGEPDADGSRTVQVFFERKR